MRFISLVTSWVVGFFGLMYLTGWKGKSQDSSIKISLNFQLIWKKLLIKNEWIHENEELPNS